MKTIANALITRLLEDGEDQPAAGQPPTPPPSARQVPHPSHEKWAGARRTFDDLWAQKEKARDLYLEIGRSIRYSHALAEIGYTRDEVRGPVPASVLVSTDNMPANHPGRRVIRSYAKRFPDAVIGAKLPEGGIVFFNNPHNPRTGNPDYPTYAEFAEREARQAAERSAVRRDL